MNAFKSVGGAGGIFHIFVPGLFLLLNLAAGVYFSPFVDTELQDQIKALLTNPTAAVIIAVGFGYLIGVVLRIFRCELADRLSARVLRIIYRRARGPKSPDNLYAHEGFPYTEWLGTLCLQLPPDVKDFYDCVWKGKNSGIFLNYSKVMIISEDERAANEIYATEGLSRYISGMLYALFIATLVILVTLVSRIVDAGTVNVALVVILVGYVAAILGILANFRFLRVKEVFAVFAAAYKNRGIFPCTPLGKSKESTGQSAPPPLAWCRPGEWLPRRRLGSGARRR